MIISEDAYLEHYGVRGMKWGVRKKRASSSSAKKGSPPKNGWWAQPAAKNSPLNRKEMAQMVAIGLGAAFVLARLADLGKAPLPPVNIDMDAFGPKATEQLLRNLRR